ncbi:MAG: DHH family phosphoesterase, partial [Casimicrobiaceae bacterium]
LRPRLEVPGALLVELPDEAWARRAIGVLANMLAQRHPRSAIAIAVPGKQDGYTVSVRVPPTAALPADEFCRRFPGGNGRKRAAGINHLPASELQRFAGQFEASFRVPAE